MSQFMVCARLYRTAQATLPGTALCTSSACGIFLDLPCESHYRSPIAEVRGVRKACLGGSALDRCRSVVQLRSTPCRSTRRRRLTHCAGAAPDGCEHRVGVRAQSLACVPLGFASTKPVHVLSAWQRLWLIGALCQNSDGGRRKEWPRNCSENVQNAAEARFVGQALDSRDECTLRGPSRPGRGRLPRPGSFVSVQIIRQGLHRQ